jgi:nitrous oxide reductase
VGVVGSFDSLYDGRYAFVKFMRPESNNTRVGVARLDANQKR